MPWQNFGEFDFMLLTRLAVRAMPFALALALAPATAAVAADPTADPTDPAPAATSPAPEPAASPTDDPAAGPQAGQDGGEPQEPAPAKPGKIPTAQQQQQTQAQLIAKQQAQEAARQAVAEARAAYESALAKHRIAQARVAQLLRRSRTAASQAADLRRDIGNLARMAYSSGNTDFLLMESVLDAETPQEALAGVSTAQRAATHKDTQLAQALQLQAQADDLAAQARTLAERTAAQVKTAKAELDRAVSLAKTVDLSITPPGDLPPVDLTTKSDWVFPTVGQITSEAGMRYHPILHYTRCHAGADITAPEGSPIYAVDDGVVLSAGMNGGYGNFTLIAHGHGMTSAYGHQSVILVKAGDRVTRGQLIGQVGSTGLSTGPHLHFEARHLGVPYNPRGWLEDHPELRVPVC